jgi:hypothetical protein
MDVHGRQIGAGFLQGDLQLMAKRMGNGAVSGRT